MNNKKISSVTIVLVLLMLILLGYVFIYFLPAQAEITALKSQIQIANMETATYRQYLTDSAPLEAEIQSIQDEIDRLHAEGYVSDSTVNFDISNAIQLHNVSLTSVSVGSVTTVQDNRALPINLSLTGSLYDVLGLIRYFENNQEGSYMVGSTTIRISGQSAITSVIIYLCTPNV